MLFASEIFLFYFLPLFLAVYYLGPRGGRTLVIALASYVFYGWWRPDFVVLMLISTFVDFQCGRWIQRDQAQGLVRRRWMILSVVVNLGLLAYFKYANFGVESFNQILESMGLEAVSWTAVILPVGISFYTFQSMSYSIDVFRKTAPPVRDFRDFMCYVSMFPQLIAGPIVRYNSVADQLHNRTHTFEKFATGVIAFQAGLAKKLLIADMLAPLADEAFSGAYAPSTADAWLGTLAYTFQIYFDFSGYSDMAIGLGLMIGFRFPINFDQPYRSISITDFWRRWHVSLSTFLRDYLYIPLGGNSGSALKTYRNLALVMLLGGLWHGAAWTYIAWGAYQGFWLIVERLSGKRPFYWATPRPVQIGLTFVLAMFGWVLFRAPDMVAAGSHMAAMCGFPADGAQSLLDIRPIHVLGGVVAALVVWGCPTTQALVKRPPASWAWALQLLFVLALGHLFFQDVVPFLYFQF